MQSPIRTKADVETHSDNFGPQRPAVNVKVYGSLQDVTFPLADADDEGLTLEWIEEHLSDEELAGLFWLTCEFEWEMIQQDAETIFGEGVTVHAEGRSGGWAVVDGLDEIEDWDAVALAKWRKFARYARQIADGIPEQMAYSIAANEYACWKDEQAELAGVHQDVHA